jgi:hypothetical protein
MKNDNCLPSIYQGQPTPIVGFILQKDVYTTNLLYANDQFSTKSLRKRLPFRTGSGRKPNNPSSSLTILRQNGYMSENSEDEDLFYMRNTFRPKKLRNKHLKFPLPKIKPVPLTNAILREDICKQDVRIKYMEDDLNITSKFGKKILYNLKENNTFYNTKFKEKPKFNIPLRNKDNENKKFNTLYKPKMKKYKSEYKFNKLSIKRYNKYRIKDNKNVKNILPVRQAIYQINSELKLIELEDKERKRSFCKNEFFATQLNTNSNNNNNETSSNKNKSLYDPMDIH